MREKRSRSMKIKASRKPTFSYDISRKPLRTENSCAYYFYLKDHLGNNNMIADANGQGRQFNFYYPYGMPSTNESANLDKQPYKFGGKEYETMHGLNLYDFEARPYDPILGRFLTPDPLAEKCPWINPYAYCNNNPVNRIDPTGLTDYKINEKGYIYDNSNLWDKIKRFFNGPDKTDKLIATNGNTLTMNAGTMSEVKEYKKDGKVKGHFFNVSNDKAAEQIHEFVSENAKVEWGRTRFNNSKKSDNIISTSHKESTESVVPSIASELLSKGYDVTELTHSHPKGGVPSGYTPGDLDSGDKDFVNYINQYYPNNTTIHRVYDVEKKQYIYYNNAYIYKYENKK